jgi:nucleoside 2-deoxyribosyltransferase
VPHYNNIVGFKVPPVVDGTAWDIGYFCAKKSPEQEIIGIRTDFRQAGGSEGAVVNSNDRVFV